MGGKQTNSPWVSRLIGDSTEYLNEAGKVVCHGVAVVRSLVWPGSFTLFSNGKQTNIYVGDGIKFTDKLRPFPLSPPTLNNDPEEYGEFVLPEVKVLSPEEIQEKITQVYDDCWGKYDSKWNGEESGAIELDDVKKLAADIKAKVEGKEEPGEVNDAAIEEAFADCEKDEEGNIGMATCKSLLISIYPNL